MQNRKRIALIVKRTAAVNGKTVLAVKFQGGGILLVDVNQRDAALSDGKSQQFGTDSPAETVRRNEQHFGLTVGKADKSENFSPFRKRIQFRNLRQSGTDFAFKRENVPFAQKMMRSSDGSLPQADQFVRLPVVGPGDVDNFFVCSVMLTSFGVFP